MEPKIIFNKVTKKYNLFNTNSDKLKSLFVNKSKDFYALRDISFRINEGETVGIIGINGSGKSTLSNLLAQVIPPTSGSIIINGEPSLIAISAGLNNKLTGKENIEMKCLMQGISKEKTEELMPLIIEFADIGDFINQPVKNYSSGMKSRLGFAISVHTDPDILIIDEALSVGDQTFYDKCVSKIDAFKKQGKTIIFISHSVSQVKTLCDRVMWIHFGTIKEFAESDKVVQNYNNFIQFFNELSEQEKKELRKKRLIEQYEEPYKRGQFKRSRRKKKLKAKSMVLLLQLTVIILITLISAYYMFV